MCVPIIISISCIVYLSIYTCLRINLGQIVNLSQAILVRSILCYYQTDIYNTFSSTLSNQHLPSGPTYDPLPPFRFSTSVYNNTPYVGLPDLWTFPWLEMYWNWLRPVHMVITIKRTMHLPVYAIVSSFTYAHELSECFDSDNGVVT